MRPIDVGTAPIAVGRAEESEIQLDEARVSRHHCVIFSRAGRLHVQDQGSANGTFVNGEATTHSKLSHGDEILVGSTKIRVEVAGLAGLYGVALRRATSTTPPPPDTAEPPPLRLRRGWPPEDPGVVRRLGFLLASSDDPKGAADAAVALLLEAIPVDRVFLLVAGESGGAELRALASTQRGGATSPRGEPSRALSIRVLEGGAPLVCLDVGSDPELSDAPDLVGNDVASVLVGPLLHQGDRLGVLYADGALLGAVTRDSVGVFQGVVAEAALALGRALRQADIDSTHERLRKERDDLDRLVRTLEREVQHRSAQTEDQRLELALKVTELEHLREARQSLAQGLLQDTKTLVGGIEARVAAAREAIDDASVREQLDVALVEARRIVSVTDDTVAVVQMEDGEYGLSTSPVSIASMVESALARNTQAAGVHGVSLSGEAPSAELMAIADPLVMSRVLDNLVVLAVKAAGQGGSVTVTGREVGSHVELVVGESGPGTSEAEREREMARWMRSTSTSARLLGASYHFCRLAVEAHGGAIRLGGDRGSREWIVSLPAHDKGFEDTVTH